MKRKKGNPKLWSVTHIRDDRYPHILVRITELRGSPFLYLGRQIDGKARYSVLQPKVTRVSLGSTPKEQEQAARALALNEIERIAKEEKAPTPHRTGGPLTLALLADRYERDGFAGRTDAYKRDALASIRRVGAFLGADTALNDVKPSDVQKYVAHRLGQGVTASARGDLVALSIGINWAVGEGLLEVNPLAAKRAREAMKIEHKPRRPVASPERYQKLQAVAGSLPPAFGVLLDLAWHTGHRIAAILGLRWQDVTLEQSKKQPHGAITWYAGVRPDRKKHEHVLPMNAAACAALARWKQRAPGIGSGFVFPDPRDATKPLARFEAKRWLKQAEHRAKLSHVKQGGWHMFRRGWATARKHLPIQDVAVGGGWLDTVTPATIYQQADAETTLAVATHVA
ncbi:MAG TPA: tyrosine-type recombinase/integrase [Gemmatimonadales bacterium]|nr:tyrosine-type recombinase/integrase [Gemmatimonadales bacterium]